LFRHVAQLRPAPGARAKDQVTEHEASGDPRNDSVLAPVDSALTPRPEVTVSVFDVGVRLRLLPGAGVREGVRRPRCTPRPGAGTSPSS